MSSFDLQTQQITRINPIVRFDLASHICVLGIDMPIRLGNLAAQFLTLAMGTYTL